MCDAIVSGSVLGFDTNLGLFRQVCLRLAPGATVTADAKMLGVSLPRRGATQAQRAVIPQPKATPWDFDLSQICVV